MSAALISVGALGLLIPIPLNETLSGETDTPVGSGDAPGAPAAPPTPPPTEKPPLGGGWPLDTIVESRTQSASARSCARFFSTLIESASCPRAASSGRTHGYGSLGPMTRE